MNTVLIFGVIGFLLPMIYGFIFGFPIPHVHDELSYLLAADTFASGHLTNPTPPLWEHFESPHILLTPSYMSKYPPMQGLFLAAGQIAFGHPIFGVWLSCGFAAAAVFWMLAAWTKFSWAVLGTSLMILLIGINSYWAQSYWGGMVAAAGGALFFGGFRRLFKELSVGNTLLMTLGGAILINSRPFEGFITMLPALTVFGVWLLRDRVIPFSNKLLRVLLPAALLTGIVLSAMAYYNFRVTGNSFTLPYAEHHRQYFSSSLFVFQSKNENSLKGNERLQRFQKSWTKPRTISLLCELTGLPDGTYLRQLYAFPLLIIRISAFLLSPPLWLVFCILSPFAAHKNKWLAFIAGTILFVFLCMSFAIWWDGLHYSAPLTCCIYLLTVEGLRYFSSIVRKKTRNKYLFDFIITLVIASTVFSVFYFPKNYLTTKDFEKYGTEIYEKLSQNESVDLRVASETVYLKGEIERAVESLPGKYLAIVTYDANHSVDDDIVFNLSDIENSKLIWANDLGREKNKILQDYYKDRKVLFISVASSQVLISPPIG